MARIGSARSTNTRNAIPFIGDGVFSFPGRERAITTPTALPMLLALLATMLAIAMCLASRNSRDTDIP